MSASNKDVLEEMITMLCQRRDELAVKLELGKMEVKEEWDKVVLKLDELKRRHQRVKDAGMEAKEEVLTALNLLGDEVKAGLKRMRDAM